MARIVVIGGANLDVKGRSAAPVIAATSNPGTVVMTAGGVARNIAHNLAQLGQHVALVTALGADGNGDFLRRETAAAGVDMAAAVTVAAATGSYLALLDERGEMLAAINDMRGTALLSPEHLAARRGLLQAAEFLVADCNISEACLAWLCAFARDEGKRLLIEPVSVAKAQRLLRLPVPLGLYVATPNVAQLVALGGLACAHALGIAHVVEHRGPQGALVSDGRSAVAVAPCQVTVRDVTGAGDAAVAGLVCGLVEGRSMVEAARMGQATAALKLQSADSVARTLSRASLAAMMERSA